MTKWLMIGFLAVLSVLAGFLFGIVCRHIEQVFGVLLDPAQDLLTLLLQFLAAALSLSVCAGLVVTLVRPLGAAWIVLALSAAAVLAGWQWSLTNAILVLICFVAASLYAARAARDMKLRINFSTESARVGLDLFLITLALLASGSFYRGFSRYVAEEGFEIPEAYIQSIEQVVEGQLAGSIPEEQREEALRGFRGTFAGMLDSKLDEVIQGYGGFVPAILAFAVFTTLMSVLRLLAWIPEIFLLVIHGLLKAVGITRLVHETVEVERLVLA